MAKKKSTFSNVKNAPTKTAPFVSDYYLWSKVAKSVSPLKGKNFPIDISEIDAQENANQEDIRKENLKPEVPKHFVPNYFVPNYFSPSYSPPISLAKNNHLNIEPKMVKRLARGKMPIDATLDLHDLRQDEAHTNLVQFLQIAYARNNRNVLIITGKGKKKSETIDYELGVNYQHGVLRNMLPIWLKGASLRQIVSGHEQAATAHGGSGAFYVRLKKKK